MTARRTTPAEKENVSHWRQNKNRTARWNCPKELFTGKGVKQP